MNIKLKNIIVFGSVVLAATSKNRGMYIKVGIGIFDYGVDILYRGLFNDILKKMAKDETIINKGAQILFASKYLERVGDHVTNICEWIIFSSKGDYVDLNE